MGITSLETSSLWRLNVRGDLYSGVSWILTCTVSSQLLLVFCWRDSEAVTRLWGPKALWFNISRSVTIACWSQAWTYIFLSSSLSHEQNLYHWGQLGSIACAFQVLNVREAQQQKITWNSFVALFRYGLH